jgi:hypothetical protein
MEYTKEYLEKLAKANLIAPQKMEVYDAMVRETLRDLIRGDENDTVIEEYIQCGDLVPLEYVSDLSAIINELAKIILEEREDAKLVLIEAQGTLEDAIQNIDLKIQMLKGYE